MSRSSKNAPIRLLLGALVVAAGASCRATASGADADPGDIVLAEVNGVPLSLEDAMDTFLSSHAGHGVLVRGEPAVRELTGRLVEQQLFLAEADTLGITSIPGLNEAVDTYRRRSAELLYWNEEVDRRAVVTDQEVEDFYAKGELALDLTIVESKSRERAEELRALVEGGADMAKLASAESIHESASFGGELVNIRRGVLTSALDEAAFALVKSGELSPVVQTPDGFAFLRLDERVTNLERPDRSIALPQIRSVLESRRREEAQAETRAAVRERAGVVVHEDLLTLERFRGEDSPEEVVAEVGEERLTMADLREAVDLDALEAVGEEEANRAILGIADHWAMDAAMDVVLAETGHLDREKVVDDTRGYEKSAILGTLYRDYVYSNIEISEEDVRAYYEKHKEDRFRQPVEFLPSYIVVETKEEARELMKRIEAGEEISALAKEHSIDPFTAAHGGQIGWIKMGDTLPEIEQRMLEMKPGELAGPIETEAGYFVLRLHDRRDHNVIPYERARAVAHEELLEERKREARAVWAERLRERADIEIFEPGIRAAVEYLEARAAEQEAEEGKAVAKPMPDMSPPSSPGGPH